MSRSRWSALLFVLALVTACAPQSADPSPTTSPAEPSSSASASPSPTPVASASEDPSPTEAAAVDEWTEVLGVEAGSAQLSGDAIVRGSAGFLATGSRWEGTEGGPRLTQRYLWHSPDGREWRELPFPSEFGDLFLQALSITANGDYVIHAGRTVGGRPEAELVALRSADGGESWHEFETGLPDNLFVQAIEMGPTGYLLVGGQSADSNPTLWLSDDAVTWEQVYEFEQTDFFVQLDDADGGAEGYVVLGRRIEGEGGPYQRFAFASADGREWINAEEPFGPDDQTFVPNMTVASFGPDWIATLGQPNGAPTTVRFSANGLEWSDRGTLEAEPNTSAGVLEHSGLGLLYAPQGYGFPLDGIPGAWLSTDGAAWTDIGLESGAWVADAAESPGMLALIGSVPASDGFTRPAIWIHSTE